VFSGHGFGRGAFFAIPTDYQKINSPPPEVVFANPFGMAGGKKINGVSYSFNGGWRDFKCSSDDRDSDGKSCGEPVQIQPGPHVLHVILCTSGGCGGLGDAWRWNLRFNVGLRERVTVDLGKLAATVKGGKGIGQTIETRGDAGVIARVQMAKPIDSSPCVKAIEAAIFVDTCRASGFAELRSRVVDMHRICAQSWSRNTDLLHELVLWDVAHLTPQRCYKPEELKKLPRFLTEWSFDRTFWPSGTIEDGVSSWSWARSTGKVDLFAKFSGEEFRKRILKQIDIWRGRQLVIDQLIDVVLDPKRGLPVILAASEKAKFSMNPVRPAGHRNFGLSVLAQNFPEVANDPRVSALLAKSVLNSDGDAKGSTRSPRESASGSTEDASEENSATPPGAGGKIHCAFNPEARRLIGAFLADKSLTIDEWRAIVGFMQRTPRNASMRECGSAAWQEIKGPVSQEQRLRDVARYDCDSKRDEEVRGKTLSELVRDDYTATPAPLRIKMLNAFPDCIAF